MEILVTGTAGFIGMHLARKLLEGGHRVMGIDNLNSYYDPALKYARLKQLGISENQAQSTSETASCLYPGFSFQRMDICDREQLDTVFSNHQFDQVCHLAAQAGVQYSFCNPDSYIHSNIQGFYEVLERCCRHHIPHLLFASSSSVYGFNQKYPYSTDDPTDQPVSLYAATKKSNELMAYAYATAHQIHITGFRFFTVYGPWGRPDMAPSIFTDAILHDRPVRLNNKGKMWRDFTFIDDIIQGIMLVSSKEITTETPFFRVYNIGNSHPASILDLLQITESIVQKQSVRIYVPLPAGDVICTYADIGPMQTEYGYEPEIGLEEGMNRFIKWYRSYYQTL